MCEVQEFLDGLCKTFRKFKEMRRLEMVQILNQVRCCECGHKMRMQKVEVQNSLALKTSTPARIRNILLISFLLVLLLYGYILHAVRRHNRIRTYGSSACESTFLYKYTDCEVIY
ncbi:uncharacterized protein Dana_GF15316 [Drosophila ananassae]|uniref:Uncharacterized protein n=1 Tax=Drosophila ananassae TaxID=7217 RepID=B3MJE8_DROAN|nr:uncharacterized protein LOC6498129 [Drosophila ananassae]EDV31358.1 uncharacterized protein Dana_GF15316 [Drosophila ananassae]